MYTNKSKALYQPCSESRRLTDMEQRETIRKDREQLRHDYHAIRAGQPSSKQGREMYYEKAGIPRLPLVLLRNLRCRLFGTKVWYSKSGRRIEY